MKERREWINAQRALKLGEIPAEIKPFYE